MDGAPQAACDVAIAGGGPVGAALALALHAAGIDALLIEARQRTGALTMMRPLALSYGSRLILERIGVWDALSPVTPITRIHISHRGRFGRAVLDAAEADVPALGYVTDYARVVAAFDAAIERAGVRAIRGAQVTALAHDARSVRVEYARGAEVGDCVASLAAIADGSGVAADVGVRTIDYRQDAVTAIVEADRAHRNLAYERFTPDGPLALLPFGDAYAVVWTVPPQLSQPLVDTPPDDFLERLQSAFGARAGRFTRVASRAAQHLTLRVAAAPTCGRAVLIGNAAQALHPVAGQGFNLGLRDAWELAMATAQRGAADPQLPQAYAARRRIDRSGGVGFTDALVKIFSNDAAPVAAARGVGLALLDNVPFAKRFVARRMIFGSRG